jgi:hypothetical protein
MTVQPELIIRRFEKTSQQVLKNALATNQITINHFQMRAEFGLNSFS